MRFTVHAHREVTPGRWYREFVGAFEGPCTRGSVDVLMTFATRASGHPIIALQARSETHRRVQTLYGAFPNPPAIPFAIVNDVPVDELRAIVNDPDLAVPDSVHQVWDQLESNMRKPTLRIGEIPA